MFCVLFLGLDPVTRIFLQWWQMQNLFQYVSQLSTDAQVGIAVAILVPIIGAVWKWWKRPSPFAIAIEGMKPTNTGWRLMMVTIRNGLQVPVNVVEIRSCWPAEGMLFTRPNDLRAPEPAFASARYDPIWRIEAANSIHHRMLFLKPQASLHMGKSPRPMKLQFTFIRLDNQGLIRKLAKTPPVEWV